MAGVPTFWDSLGDGERTGLLRTGTTRTVPSGEVLLHEGEGGDDILVILNGWAKVLTRDVDGYESTLAARGPGDIVGEMAALVPIPRTAEVRAITEVRGLRLSGAAFEALLLREPAVALTLLRVLVIRLRHADQWRARCGSMAVGDRVRILLAELLGQHQESGALPLPFSQEELAGFVAGSRKSVCRALNQLRAEGVIETGRRHITVLRPAALTVPMR